LNFSKLIHSENELHSLVEPLSKNLSNGDLIFLEGGMASGKTTLIREIISSASKAKKKLFHFQGSPTYQRANTYNFKDLNILHFDLHNIKEDDQSDMEDYIQDHCIIMEWPRKKMKEKYLSEALFISISIKNDARLFKFHTLSQKWLKIIKLI
jgi:tRNA threonylcarbamoyl adenosine modification protein YjeE|tara:strand:- start:184 stop:642 length:459 start_codon:yes stop_codon:yes gene_type:complete